MNTFRVTAALALTTALTATRPAAAQRYGVQIETVNSYSPCFGTNPNPNLVNSNSSGQAFAKEMARVNFLSYAVPSSPQSCTSRSCWYQDGYVWATDFLDPQLGTNSFADDTNNFDQTGLTTAISFYQGHALGDWSQGPEEPCLTSQWQDDCSSGPSGNTEGGCVLSPGSEDTYGSGFGICRWNIPSLEPNIVTCGSGDTESGTHVASFGSGMAYGESSTFSGAWRGAGTNGGVGIVFAKHSFGLWLPFASEWWPLFGGIDLWAGVAIAWGDSEDSSGYGYAVANQYSNNPYASLKTSYLSALNNINDGAIECPTLYGGTSSFNGGINGCGCHAIMTVTSSPSCGTDIMQETWYDVQVGDVSNCQTSGAYYYWYLNCNYNAANNAWAGGP